MAEIKVLNKKALRVEVEVESGKEIWVFMKIFADLVVRVHWVEWHPPDAPDEKIETAYSAKVWRIKGLRRFLRRLGVEADKYIKELE